MILLQRLLVLIEKKPRTTTTLFPAPFPSTIPTSTCPLRLSSAHSAGSGTVTVYNHQPRFHRPTTSHILSILSHHTTHNLIINPHHGLTYPMNNRLITVKPCETPDETPEWHPRIDQLSNNGSQPIRELRRMEHGVLGRE